MADDSLPTAKTRQSEQGALKQGGIDLMVMPPKLKGRLPLWRVCSVNRLRGLVKPRNYKASAQRLQICAWPLYRYDPRKIALGENPFKLDSRDPKIPVSEYMKVENRFKMLQTFNPERAAMLDAEEQEFINSRWAKYKYLAERHLTNKAGE